MTTHTHTHTQKTNISFRNGEKEKNTIRLPIVSFIRSFEYAHMGARSTARLSYLNSWKRKNYKLLREVIILNIPLWFLQWTLNKDSEYDVGAVVSLFKCTQTCSLPALSWTCVSATVTLLECLWTVILFLSRVSPLTWSSAIVYVILCLSFTVR